MLHIISNFQPIKDWPKLSAIMHSVGSLVSVCGEILQVPFGISSSLWPERVQAVNLQLGGWQRMALEVALISRSPRAIRNSLPIFRRLAQLALAGASRPAREFQSISQWLQSFSRRRSIWTMNAVRTVLAAALSAVKGLTKIWN
jgi:hypothetical protein